MHPVVAALDAVDNFHTTRGANPARRTFATRLDRAELHRIARQPRHIGAVVVHHDATVANHRTHGGIGFIVQRQVPLRLGHVGTQRPAHLHCLDRAPGCRATPVVDQQFAQRNTKSFFHQATVLDIACQLDRQGAT